MALVTTLKAAKLRKGLKWVYGGAITGIMASLVIAFILQIAFPAVTSGSNREIIEGAVGIFAVVMMILIGIWLHSKSSVKKWNAFMESQMETVTKTGSFISMFALSEHLVEFRKRLLAVVICFFLLFCVSLLFADQIYQYVTQSFQQKLIVLGPNDILWIYIRLASLMAFTITLPYTVLSYLVFHQTWFKEGKKLELSCLYSS